MRMRLSAVAPLAERVAGAFVVFEQCPPTEVLAGWREREFHPARAELSVGALDVGAVEEQVGVGEAIRNRTTWFIGRRGLRTSNRSWSGGLTSTHRSLPYASSRISSKPMPVVQKSSAACWSATGTMTLLTRVITMSPSRLDRYA